MEKKVIIVDFDETFVTCQCKSGGETTFYLKFIPDHSE